MIAFSGVGSAVILVDWGDPTFCFKQLYGESMDRQLVAKIWVNSGLVVFNCDRHCRSHCNAAIC